MSTSVVIARGQLWWARVPFNEDPTKAKDRLVVVVGWSSFGRRDDRNILVMPVTTFGGNPAKARGGDYELTQLAGTGLKAGAFVRCHRLMALAPNAILFDRKPAGVLHNDDWQQVLTAVERLLTVGQYLAFDVDE